MPNFVDLKLSEIMSKNVDFVKPNAKIHEALGHHHVHSLPVMTERDLGSFKGILNYKKIMRSKVNMNADVINFASMPPIFEAMESITKVVPYIVESDFRAVPIKIGDKIVGIVSAKDIARAMAYSSEFKNVKASDIMNTKPITIELTASVGKALSLMREKNVSRLPVLEGKRVVGIIAFADIVKNFFQPIKKERRGDIKGEKDRIMKFPVSGIMARNIVNVQPNSKFRLVYEKMDKFGLNDVLVLDGARLVGLITMKDITKLATSLLEETRIDFTISGFKPEFDDAVHVKRDIDKLLQKNIGNIAPIDYRVKAYNTAGKSGKASKFSVHAHVETNHGMYMAKGVAWDLMSAFEQCNHHLLRLIKERQERIREKDRYSRF